MQYIDYSLNLTTNFNVNKMGLHYGTSSHTLSSETKYEGKNGSKHRNLDLPIVKNNVTKKRRNFSNFARKHNYLSGKLKFPRKSKNHF